MFYEQLKTFVTYVSLIRPAGCCGAGKKTLCRHKKVQVVVVVVVVGLLHLRLKCVNKAVAHLVQYAVDCRLIVQ